MLCVSAVTSCTRQKKELNKRITLWRKDKIPYGTLVAFENLPQLFPDAAIKITNSSPDRSKSFSLKDLSHLSERVSFSKGKTAYVIISPDVAPDDREVLSLIEFAAAGNDVFISSFHINDLLQ